MENIADILRIAGDFIFDHMLLWNFIFAVVIVFFQRKNPKSVWAWLLLLYFMPIVGFIFFLFLGQDMGKRKMFRVKELEDQIGEAIRRQEHQLMTKNPAELDAEISDYKDMIIYNLETSGAVLTDGNDIDIYTDGKDKFKALLEDLRSAEHFIHMQYYIIKDDVLFQQIREVLAEKAAEGVEVRILYDAMGCRTFTRKRWKELNEAGIMTAEFFPAMLKRLQLRINYRNHRKIVVVDNRVAYVGGFNIGKEYVDLDDKFGHWRDTHLRIQGNAVLALQLRFIMDWNYAAKENLLHNAKVYQAAVPGTRDKCEVQIISSGPDTSAEQIRDNYLRLITKAEKRIYIQTPYFIPDESIFSALMIAVHSGVEVNIMIPCKPDHPFVYWATYSYIGDLVMAGANCYTYENGFLHTKLVMADGKAFCCGTANMDIRSFALNFEVNAVVYDSKKTMEMENNFLEDLQYCKQITRDVYTARPLKLRFKEQICRLLSPLL